MQKKHLLQTVSLSFFSFMASYSGLSAQTHPPLIASAGQVVTIPGGDPVPYTNAGFQQAAIFANGTGASITVTGGGGIVAETTNMNGIGVIYAQSGGYIDLGNGSVIKGHGLNPPPSWTGSVGISARDAGSFITGSNVTVTSIGDHPYGVYALNGGRIDLYGLTDITLTNIVNANNTSFGLIAQNGTLSAQDVNLVIGGTSGLYGTFAYSIRANAIASSAFATSLAITGNLYLDVEAQSVTGIMSTGKNMSGVAAEITVNSVSGKLTANAAAGNSYAVWAASGGNINVLGDVNLISTSGAWNLGGFAQSGGSVTFSGSGLSQWDLTSTDGTAAGFYSANAGSLVNQIGSSSWKVFSNRIAYGAYATTDGAIQITGNSTWNVSSGNNASGLYATAGGAIIQSGSSRWILSSVNMAVGLFGNNGGSIVQSGASDWTISGDKAYGIRTEQSGASVSAHNITMSVSGITSAYALYGSGGQGGNAHNITIVNGNIHSNDTGIFVEDGYLNADLTNVLLHNDNLIAFDIKSTNPGDSYLDLTATASRFKGSALTDANSRFDLKLQNGSFWEITGNSNLNQLVNDDSHIIFAMPYGGSFKTLAVQNYAGNHGYLTMNTHLGNDASPSDLLIIDGGSATGNTFLNIMNAGGAGDLTTGDGILIVDTVNGATTDAGAFVLAQRVAAGAYDYTLHKGGAANAQNWYLRSSANYRAEVPLVYSIIPLSTEYGFQMVGTLHERVGETRNTRQDFASDNALQQVCMERSDLCVETKAAEQQSGNQGYFHGSWGRMVGFRGTQNDRDFVRSGSDYDYNLGIIQTGFDLFGKEDAEGNWDKFGIYFGYGNGRSSVRGTSAEKVGRVDTDMYSLGLYYTHMAASGWYTDAVLQGSWYKNEAESVNSQSISPDGSGILASLEAGYAFRFGNDLAVEPQAQLVYQHISYDNVSDPYGRFSLDDTNSLRGRVGVRVVKNWFESDNRPHLVSTWIRGNIWHEFGDKNEMTVSSASVDSRLLLSSKMAGTWSEIGVGINGHLTDNVTIFSSLSYNHSLDSRQASDWSGQAGLTVNW